MYKNLGRGKWIQSFRYKDENGKTKQKQVRGTTKKETDIAKNEFLSSLERQKNEININTSNPMFTDFLRNYLAYKRGQVKSSTYAIIESHIDNHIKDYFADMRIKDVNVDQIVAWKDSLDGSLKASSKNKIFVVLRGILKYAELVYDDYKSHVSLVSNFRDDSYSDDTVKFWTLDQFKTFDNAVDNATHKLFYRLLYLTGLRLGEAIALTWDDIDFDSMTLRVNKTYTNLLTKDEIAQGIRFKITTPKTKNSVRTVKMPVMLVDDLKKYIIDHNDKYIFGGERPYTPSAMFKAFVRYTDKTDLPRISVHGLRHSHASFLINNGANALLVSRRLGHASISTTMDIYAHLFDKSEDDVIDMINNALTCY